jgi:hypothetical protein
VADKLSEQQLEAILSQQIELAKHDRKMGGRDASREKALDYYFGNLDKYVPPEENRSKVVSRDGADTVNWVLPQIMRAFTASDSMFLAEPETGDDPQYAKQATHGLNYVFWKENNGYEQVYAATWDSLVHGDAIVKTFYDDEPIYSAPRYHEGLSEDERAMLAGDDAVEVLAQTANTSQQPDPLTGELADVTTYDLKLRQRKANGRYVVDVIPPEEFLIDADATSLEEAAFKAHWQRKTRSALVAMGYDKDDVAAIPEAARNETAEEQARRMFINADATDASMQMVDYYECFVMVDIDGDGVAEMVRACYAGGANGKLLDWEVWEDEDPFDNIPCEPIPHRWDSRSLMDETIDIQDVKTVLTRQMLNSTYWVNNPQPVVSGKIKNPEALTDGQFGQPIFADAGTTIAPLLREYIGDKALLGIHYMDEVSTRRTGVSNQSMALDPETLQNQSATANQNATDASRSQPEMIARNMAEFGWTKVGRKLLRLMAKHEDGPRSIQVKGKPVQIDPRTWNPDMHVTINVGLGTGSRDRDAAMLSTVLQQQIAYTDRIGQVFPEKALDMLPYIHSTLTKFAESTGLKNPEMYWPDISQDEIEQGKQILAQRQQQPNPQIMVEQAKGEIQKELKAADVQAQLAIEQGRQQTQQQLNVLESERQTRTEQAQLEADLATKEADRQNAIQLETIKQQGAMALKQMEIAAQERMHAATLAHQATIAANRPEPRSAQPN